MQHYQNRPKLLDLIDIKFLQKLQDTFANTMGVATLIVDATGPITKPSNFTKFCKNQIRANELGLQKCNECDIEGEQLALKKGEPIIYTCHMGLIHFVVPIIVNNQQIASILGGQIALSKPDCSHFQQRAKELGIDADKQFFHDLDKVKVVHKKNIEEAVKLLSLFANSISETANRNYELIKNSRREKILINIISKIRNSLDIKVIQNEIANQIGTFLNADSVRIAEYDYNLQDYTVRREAEYKSSNNIKSMEGLIFKNIQGFNKYIRDVHFEGKDIIFNNLETYLDQMEIRGTGVEDFYREFGFISSAAINIYYKDKYLGDFVITFEHPREFSDDEIKLLKALADQAGSAFYQATLHQKTIEQAAREALLRKITETIRETIDVNETKKTIVTEIGKTLDADRVFLVEFDSKTNKPKVLDEYSEYKIPELKSLVGYDFSSPKVKALADVHKQKKPIIFYNLEDLIKKYDIQDSDTIEWLNETGIKSGIGMVILYGNKNFGVLAVHYTKSARLITDEDIDFLKIAAEQAGIALYQAELHSISKKQAERERILRQITNQIRSSLDFESIKHEIVNQLGKLFNADRVVVAYYDYKANNYVITEESEYKSSDRIKTFIGVDFTNTPGFSENIRGTHFQGKDIIFSDLDEYLDKNNLKNTGVENFYRDFGFISSAAVNIYYKNIFLGNLVISYENHKDFEAEEIEFLKAIADQVGVAFYQAKLYEKEKKTAQRETTLRKIIEAVRSSLDINEIKQSIVNELGKAFNADRCYFRNYDRLQNRIFPPKPEYLSSPDIKSMLNVESPQESFTYFIDAVKNRKNKFYPLIANEESLKTPAYEAYAKEFGILADYAIPIIDRQDELIWLVLHYVKVNPRLAEEDLKLLETISYQIDIAFEQITLYNEAQKTAEREALLRKIASTIRTSLNLEETFDIICSEIAKISGANRTSILKLIEKYNQYETKGEFKTSESIKGVNETNQAERAKIFEYITTYVFGKNEPLIINNINESDIPEFIKKFYENLDVKSLTVFPIKKRKDEWGILAIAYVNQYKYWTKSEINLFEIILEQIYIAITQAELYDKTLLMAKREILIMNITEKIRSSLNLDETLTYICEETAKLFNVQRSSIIVFPDKKDYMVFELKKEYKVSQNLNGYTKILELNKVAEYWGRMLTTVDKIVAIDNIVESETPEYFKNAYAEMGVKSIIGTIIAGDEGIWGDLILSEYNRARVWSNEEKDLLKIISQQISIAINQAELFENEKLMREREQISRNIIEILRSTIDKKIIKKLFVKNIGKFFDADRVFFSEYNSESKNYLPVDKDSEYLSNISEKSFIGYDWSNPGIKEYIQPLLEKREVKIPDWNEYVQQHPNMSDELKALYENSDVKSSYNFPVLYQDRIIGYFCLEFTRKVCRVSDEDIGRIRSICTQAGIALYHAELYFKAQECLFSRESFVSQFLEKVKIPTNNILDTSILLYQTEFERPIQIGYLNNIISSCNQLLELTKNTSEDSY